MSVLIFVETADGAVKKSSQEAIGYGAELAKITNTSATALVLGTLSSEELEKIGNFGCKKVLHAADNKFNEPGIQPYASALAEAVAKVGATIVVLAKSSLGDSVAARLSAKLQAGLASNVVDLPDLSNGFIVKRSIYTGKAFADTEVKGNVKILAIKKNAFVPTETTDKAEIETFNPSINEKDFLIKVTGVEKQTGDILLPEADIVVSGGRGLKGPEHWGILLDLAKALNAATACSKPVSDLDWRPHHEHVGQTGIKISPNLYIAIGISGAIQHLAGVNSSKVIVVINKDPEAPFFKSADYGIVGDAFDIVPRLTKAVLAAK